MIIMRPSRSEDLDQILQLASLTGFGLSTLPSDPEYLEERIQASLRAFELKSSKPKGETYLFVMEDTDTGKLIGTSGIISKVGGFEPFYAYLVENKLFESEHLDVHKEIRVLNLVEEHDGPCEIGSLFLHPDYQGQKLGRLLSRARFLFMAEHPELFEERVIAELRGVVDEEGRSPFWEALGRHFFDVDFPKADYLSMKNKTFIADLMPRHPIYVPLLPADAQAVLGQAHKNSEPALRMLESQGFTRNGMVDIFEAGPILSAMISEIRTVKESQQAIIHEVTDAHTEERRHVISNTHHAYRACFGTVEEVDTHQVRIDRVLAEALEVEQGDHIRYASADMV